MTEKEAFLRIADIMESGNFYAGICQEIWISLPRDYDTILLKKKMADRVEDYVIRTTGRYGYLFPRGTHGVERAAVCRQLAKESE